MVYIKIDEKQIKRMLKEAIQFQDDIVCAVNMDFMKNIAEAENRMIFDILKGLQSSIMTDAVEVVRCKDCKNFIQKGEEYLLGDVYGFCERSRTGYFDDGAEVYGNDFCSYGVKGSD